LAEALAAVPDPRGRRGRRGRWHALVAILLIATCGITCDPDRLACGGKALLGARPAVAE
jgi:hypothetical protein